MLSLVIILTDTISTENPLYGVPRVSQNGAQRNSRCAKVERHKQISGTPVTSKVTDEHCSLSGRDEVGRTSQHYTAQ